MKEIRRPTTKPKTKMNSVAEIHGATNACTGTRISRDHSRRMIVHNPIQLTREGDRDTSVEALAEAPEGAGAALMPPRDRIRRRSRADTPLPARPSHAPARPSIRA